MYWSTFELTIYFQIYFLNTFDIHLFLFFGRNFLYWIEGMDGFSPYFTQFDIIYMNKTKIQWKHFFGGSILTFFSLVHKAYVVVPLPFWHLLDTYIHFGNRNENILKIPWIEVGKKMPSSFALLKHITPPRFRTRTQ